MDSFWRAIMSGHKITVVKLKLIIPSAVSVFLGGIFFLLSLVLIAPVDYLYLGSSYSWLYVELSLLAVFAGLVVGAGGLRLKSKTVFISLRKKVLKKIFLFASFISAVGILLRIYDKYFIRGVSLQANVIENRDTLLASGINFFSVASSFMYPMAMLLPFIYLLLKRTQWSKPTYFVIVLLLSLYSFIDSISVGSRSIMGIFSFLIALYFYMLGYLKFKISFRNILLFIVLLVLLLSLSGYIFDTRTKLIGIVPSRSTQTSVYAYFIPLEDAWVKFLDANKGIYYYFILGGINFIQYLVHGFFEMLYLVDKFDTHQVLLGQQNFSVVAKFVSYVLRIPFSFSANNDVLVRTGMYNTLFGPIYYDFALWGVFFSFLLGILIGKVFLSVLRGNVLLIPLYAYFLLLLFFSLIVNMIVFGQGLYTIVSFLIFYVISRFLYARKKL